MGVNLTFGSFLISFTSQHIQIEEQYMFLTKNLHIFPNVGIFTGVLDFPLQWLEYQGSTDPLISDCGRRPSWLSLAKKWKEHPLFLVENNIICWICAAYKIVSWICSFFTDWSASPLNMTAKWKERNNMLPEKTIV